MPLYLENTFDLVVSMLHSEYVNIYIDKRPAALRSMLYKNKILFWVHYFHLMTRASVQKKDIRQILLYEIDENSVVELLSQYHELDPFH